MGCPWRLLEEFLAFFYVKMDSNLEVDSRDALRSSHLESGQYFLSSFCDFFCRSDAYASLVRFSHLSRLFRAGALFLRPSSQQPTTTNNNQHTTQHNNNTTTTHNNNNTTTTQQQQQHNNNTTTTTQQQHTTTLTFSGKQKEI